MTPSNQRPPKQTCACGRWKSADWRTCRPCRKGIPPVVKPTACKGCGSPDLLPGRFVCKACRKAQRAAYPSVKAQSTGTVRVPKPTAVKAPKKYGPGIRATIHKIVLDSRITSNGSWWATAPRDGFLSLAEQEHPRMTQSKFARVSNYVMENFPEPRRDKPDPARVRQEEAA